MASLPSICEGFWDNVLVTDIQDARVFTVKLCGSEAEFGKMMEEVQRAGASRTSLPSVDVGDVVLTQFSFDKQWYRAQVQEVSNDGSLQVLYVDYGNEETTEKENAKDAKPYTEMPRQAVTCTLNRINYTAPNVAKFHNRFRSSCLNVTFKALFVEKVGQMWSVELFHAPGNVNDWFGKLSGSLETALSPVNSPAKLPHPLNAGLIPIMTTVEQTNEVDAGSSFTCSVVYAVSPSEFWLQSSADSDSALNISAQLAELCNSPSKRPVTSPSQGQLCAALYNQDNTWYRARIVELLSTGAKVYFVDYGNIEEVSATNIAQLPSQFAEQPEYAIQASLAAVRCSGEEWSPDAIEVFSELVSVPACHAQVVGKRDDVCLVHLTIDGKSLGEQLIARGLAVEDYSDVDGSGPVHYPQQNIEGVHQVYISWLTNPADFWVQIAGCEDSLEQLSLACIQCAGQSTPLDNPSVGAACVAQYAADGNWYRGEVEACLPNSCTVLFIDHGNSEDVRRESIHPASAAVAKMPGLAYKCSLLGVAPKDAQWSVESGKLMTDLLADGGTCSFLAVQGKSYLVEVTSTCGQSVKEELLKANVVARSRRTSTISDGSQGSHHSPSRVGRVRNVDKRGKKAVDGSHHVDAAGDRAAHATTSVAAPSMANLGLKVGDMLEGLITYIESVEAIYIQPSRHQELFNELFTNISKFYHKGQGQPVSDVVADGCYMVQFGEDNEWYRAVVNSFNGDNIQVFYLDYGNVEWTTAQNMRQLLPEFATRVPAQALRCCLHDFNKTLSEEDLAKFKDIYSLTEVRGIIKSENASCAVVDLQCAQGSLSALLGASSTDSPSQAQPLPLFTLRQLPVGTHAGCLTSEESQQEFYIQLAEDGEAQASIDDALVEETTTNAKLSDFTIGRSCIAKFSEDGAWYRAQITGVREGEVDVFFVDYGNSAPVDVEDVLEISEGLSRITPLAIKCRLGTEDASQSLTEWAGDAEISVSVVEVRDGVHMVHLRDSNQVPFGAQQVPQASNSSGKATATVPCYPPMSIEIGQFEALWIIEVSQKEFYVQDCAVLQRVGEEIETKVEEETTTNAKLSDFTIGRSCIAKFSEDGAWYRAQITGVREGEVDVFFVDYGNSAPVDVEDVLEISEGLSRITPLAIKCRLVTEDASQSLTEWAGDAQIRVDVHRIEDGTCYVSLYHLTGEPFIPSPEGQVTKEVNDVKSAGESAQPPPPADSLPHAGVSTIRRLDKVFRAILSFVVSQQEFYIQQAPDIEPLSAIQATIQGEATTNAKLSDFTIGRSCIAKFSEDGAWYRAQITGVREGEVDVFFVDYGNSAPVDVEDVLEISEGLSRITPLAIKCRLVTEDASQSLTEWIGGDEVVVTVLHTAGDSVVVDLANSNGVPFFAQPTYSTDGSTQSIAGSASNLMVSSPSQSGGSLHNAPQLVAGSDVSSHSSICSSPMPQSLPSSIDGYNSAVSLNHSSTTVQNHSSTASQESIVTLPDNKIGPGEQKGYIAYIESTGSFSVQLESRKNDLAAIEMLLAKVGAEAEPDVYCPQGHFCIATYSADGCYYRAKVVDAVSVAGLSTVRFVDYGNLEQVKNSTLKVLPRSLRTQPTVALECRCKQASLLDMTLEKFTQELDGKLLSFTFEGQTEPYDVTILNLPPGVDCSPLTDSAEFSVGPVEFTEAVLPASSSKDVPAKVSHLVNPSLFYCQFDSDSMEKLQRSVDTIYVEKSLLHQTPADELAQVGTGCVVASKQGTYSRCSVVSAPDDDGLCQVHYVDQGNTDTVAAGGIYQLHKDCIDCPVQATRCSLGGIYPVLGSLWDDDATNRFSELVMGKPLTANIVKVMEGDDSNVEVKLSCGGELVTDSLVNAGFCSRIPTPDTSPADFCAQLCSQVKDKILSSSEDRTTLLSDKVNELVNGLDSALDTQLDSMTEEEGGACTAHDIVDHVTNNLINRMLSLPEPSPLDLTVSNKDVMRVEIKNILGELLEEVMRMNAAIVENLIDEGLSAADSVSIPAEESDGCSTPKLPSLSTLSMEDSSKGAAVSDVESSTGLSSSDQGD